MLLSGHLSQAGSCRAPGQHRQSFAHVRPAPRNLAVNAFRQRPVNNPAPPISSTVEKQLDTEKQSTPWAWLKEAANGAAKGAALLSLCAALVLSSGGPALAARSGGRIGGSSFSSGRSSSSFSSSSSRSSSFSSSYSTPRSYAAPSTYYSPLSRSSVVTHHSTYMTTPSVGVTFGIPMGGYPSTYAPGFGAGDFLTVAAIVAGVFAIASVAGRLEGLKSAAPATVAKLQVGVLASGGARLKRDLDALAEAADTGSAQGLHALMQEASLALLRHPEFIAYGGAETRPCSDPSDAERHYNAMSVTERARYQEETLANVRGRGVRRATLSQASGDVDEYLVVTLVVAASGNWSLPPIREPSDVRAALRAMGGLSPSDVLAVELTWTPQAEGDSMTAQQLLAEFPELRPL